MSTEWMILRHDCFVHEHDYSTIGPFASEDDAAAYIDKHDLDTPTDGGYAFAVTVLLDDGFRGSTLLDPDEYREDYDDGAGDEPLVAD